ncbi:MAG: hypothetical protein NC344_02245 [Bacteroidales bacterium]|nr:hypothetical protein [Bacteroidales bacterium]MCM1146653.1 hypothetical protein [Bacteroidales bacterium]MCM1206045.1 hypothetical protein [Bacillota bacterium]MCM1511055.1 hypothetical protein [Clostridium sp.]
MSNKKESFFWTSYSDLMTSLFFVMLVLFVLVIVLLHKRMEATEAQLEEIKKVEQSTKDLSKKDNFIYRPDYKKYVLNIEVQYPDGSADIGEMIADNPKEQFRKLIAAGREIQSFLEEHNKYQYILIIEGQASRDNYIYNYELSYQRALGLMRFWINDAKIDFADNCEILISGSGDGQLDTHSMRESGNERKNQRFLIHILPKNIFEQHTER